MSFPLTRRLFTRTAAGAAIGAAAGVAGGVAAGLAPHPGRAAEPGPFVVASPAPLATLDPGFLAGPSSLADNVFDTLVARAPDMKLAPGLALAWKPLDDTTWEFALRPGVRFHNGEAFTAAAVKFSLDRARDPAAPGAAALASLAAVEAPSDLVVRLHTRAPDPLLPARLSRAPTHIVPPAYVGQVGAEAFARQPVGTGPYRVTTFLPGERAVLQAWTGHWRGQPTSSQPIPADAEWRFMPEPTARVAALLAGKVHLAAGIPADLVEDLAGAAGVAVQRVRNAGPLVYLGLKGTAAPLADVRVRQALSLAIDRRKLATETLRGFATPAGNQVSPFDFGCKPLPLPPFAPDQARRLLGEAGLERGFSIGLQVPRRYLDSAAVGDALVRQLAAVGIKARLEVLAWPDYTARLARKTQAPLHLLGWSETQIFDAGATLYPVLRSGEPYATVALPELDALLDESRRTLDPAARAAVLWKVQDLAASQFSTLPLYREDLVFACTRQVGARQVAFTGRPDGRILLSEIHFVT